MAIESSEQVKQYLILAKKSADELRAICEGLELETTGDQATLLDRLIQLGAPQQSDVIQPQMIPLRTRDERGDLMPQAHNAIQHWRRQIFMAKGNYKEFTMLNSHGAMYTMQMRYILCPNDVLQKILKDRWYDPRYTAMDELVSLLQTSPEKFCVSIVQRTSKKGSSYIMLHAEPRAVRQLHMAA